MRKLEIYGKPMFVLFVDIFTTKQFLKMLLNFITDFKSFMWRIVLSKSRLKMKFKKESFLLYYFTHILMLSEFDWFFISVVNYNIKLFAANISTSQQITLITHTKQYCRAQHLLFSNIIYFKSEIVTLILCQIAQRTID